MGSDTVSLAVSGSRLTHSELAALEKSRGAHAVLWAVLSGSGTSPTAASGTFLVSMSRGITVPVGSATLIPFLTSFKSTQSVIEVVLATVPQPGTVPTSIVSAGVYPTPAVQVTFSLSSSASLLANVGILVVG